jgi:cob(I)alamin adenosyltransferase
MANEYTEAERERIVIHDTKLENIEMVILRLEAKVDAWQANFVSKEILEEKLKIRDEKIDRLEKEIDRLEKEKTSHKNNLPLWVASIVASISLIVSIWPHVK